MKKTSRPRAEPDEMLPEYDFTGGVRGKYVQRYREGTNVVLLDPDVAKAFKTSAAVNQALRRVLKARLPGSRRKRSA